MSEAEVKYELLIDELKYIVSIKRYFHIDLFLRLVQRKRFSSFSYIKNNILYMRLELGVGGKSEAKEAPMGTLIYDSAEDALGILLEDTTLGTHQIIVGSVDGDMDALKSLRKAFIARFRQL